MSVPAFGQLTPADRSKRSMLVGGIPGDTSEEQLRHLLSQFGLVLDFKFFNDNAGPIGYAFCEYENPEVALRAIRHLNNFQFKGHFLKVDTAANNKSQEELESFLQGNDRDNVKSNTEDLDTAEKAPEEISKAVASLPPEQMFELMKQMKMCIENNPHEARNLLLQNPQLAYALLQAQVIMRIVDPEVALKILDRPITFNAPSNSDAASEMNPNPESGASVGMQQAGIQQNAPLFPSGMTVLANMQTSSSQSIGAINQATVSQPMNSASNGMMIDKNFPNDQDMRQFRDSDMRPFIGSGMDPRMMPGQHIQMQDTRTVPGPETRIAGIPDAKAISASDPRGVLMSDPRPSHDPRGMPIVDPRAMAVPDPRAMPIPDPRGNPILDPRAMPVPDPRHPPISDPRNARSQDPRMLQNPDFRRMMPGTDPRMLPGLNPKLNEVKLVPGSDPRTMLASDPRMMPIPDSRISGPDPRNNPRVSAAVDPRMRQGSDPRLKPGFEDPRKVPTLDGVPVSAARLPAGTRTPAVATTVPVASGPPFPGPPDSLPPDQEKAALIMQVLQLSEEQIAMLPPDQRQSILILKDQIARSQIA